MGSKAILNQKACRAIHSNVICTSSPRYSATQIRTGLSPWIEHLAGIAAPNLFFPDSKMEIMHATMPSFLLTDTDSPEETEYSVSRQAKKGKASKRKQTEEDINPYEQERLDRIARNRQVLLNLGVQDAWQDFHKSMMGPPKAKKHKPKAPVPAVVTERRKSARLDPAQKPVYQDSKLYKNLLHQEVRYRLAFAKSPLASPLTLRSWSCDRVIDWLIDSLLAFGFARGCLT